MTQPAVARHIVQRQETCIEVLAQGEGRLVVLLPSLGRGAEDFAPIAAEMAAMLQAILGAGGNLGQVDIGHELSEALADLHCQVDVVGAVAQV